MGDIKDVILELIDGFMDTVFQKDTRLSHQLYKVDKSMKYSSESNKEYIENNMYLRNLQFSVLLFIHILYEEDDKLSFSEKREVKDLIKRKEGYLSEEDIKELKDTIKMRPSLYDVVEYAKANYVTYEFVNQMIKHLRLSIKDETRYDYIIDKVERRFILEKDSLD